MPFPYQCFSHFSIQQGYCHISDLVNKAYDLKLPALCLTDIESLSGFPELHDLISKRNQKSEHKVKPVAGLTIDLKIGEISERITLLAKNKNGWHNLIKIVSERNGKQDAAKPYNSDNIKPWAGDLFCISFGKPNAVLKEIFAANYLVENFNLNPVDPVYYVEDSDRGFHRGIICAREQLKLPDSSVWIKERADLSAFFDNSKSFNLKSVPAATKSGHTRILNEIENFDIKMLPSIPVYDKSVNPKELLEKLCREGWDRLILSKIEKTPALAGVYKDRIVEELGTIASAKLENYMLLVYDFVNKCRSDGVSAGLRGSAAGCLIFYLTGVTTLDPVCPDPSLPYSPNRSLMFSRFINKGRFAEGHFSLPDADIDLPPEYRDTLKNYIRTKYGDSNCANICTFLQMKGKAVIREAFRILDLSSDMADIISKQMIEETKVQDEIEEIRAERPDYNIIDFSIDNSPTIQNYSIQFKEAFDLARGLYKSIKATGCHAAGFVISNDPITDICPTRWDSNNNCYVTMLDMKTVESIGLVKMDLLSVEAFSKVDEILRLINTGKPPEGV